MSGQPNPARAIAFSRLRPNRARIARLALRPRMSEFRPSLIDARMAVMRAWSRTLKAGVRVSSRRSSRAPRPPMTSRSRSPARNLRSGARATYPRQAIARSTGKPAWTATYRVPNGKWCADLRSCKSEHLLTRRVKRALPLQQAACGSRWRGLRRACRRTTARRVGENTVCAERERRANLQAHSGA